MPGKDQKKVAGFFKKRNEPGAIEKFFSSFFGSKPKKQDESMGAQFTKSLKQKRNPKKKDKK